MAELTADGLAVKTPPRTVFAALARARRDAHGMHLPGRPQADGAQRLVLPQCGRGRHRQALAPATPWSARAAATPTAPGSIRPTIPSSTPARATTAGSRVGHGRLVDTPEGKWYMTVHSYENGYRTLGRQLLLLPIEWTADGWFRVPAGVTADSAIPMPIPGTSQQPFPDPSDDFTTPELGLQWGFWHEFDPARFTTGNGALTLAARGKSLADTSALTTPVGGHSYTVEIDVEVDARLRSGLMLFYDPRTRPASCSMRGHRRPHRQRLLAQPRGSRRPARHPAHRQRPAGDRLLLPTSRPILEEDSGVCRNLRNAA